MPNKKIKKVDPQIFKRFNVSLPGFGIRVLLEHPVMPKFQPSDPSYHMQMEEKSVRMLEKKTNKLQSPCL